MVIISEQQYRYHKNKANGYFALAIFILFMELIFLFGMPLIGWILTIPVIMIFRVGGRHLGLAKGIKQMLDRYGDMSRGKPIKKQKPYYY